MLHKDMMSFGYLGNGGLQSAASNLSPLAPPFTVDRSNTKFDSNPINNFSENTYGVPFSSSLQNWQYPHPSASAPEYYSNYETDIGSLHTTDYSYLGSEPINPPNVHWAPPNPNTTDPTNNPFSYSDAPKQYYPPYQVVDGVSSVGLSEANYELLSSSGIVPVVGSSKVDYSQGLSSVEFAPPWGGYWNGLSKENCGRRTDIDGSFHFEETDFPGPHVYRDYLKQEVVPVEFSRCEENSTATQRKYADVYGNEKNAEFLARDQQDDSLCQTLRYGLTESSKAPILGTSSKFTESNLESPSQELVTFSSNLQKPNSLCRNGLQLFDSCISDCTSVTKTSVMPVIRPPISGTSFPVQDTVASKSIDIGDVTSVNRKDVSTYNQTIEKEPLLPLNSEVKEGFLDANYIGFHTSRNDQHIYPPASSSLTKPLCNNILNHGINVRGGQIPDINVPHGFTMSVDGTEAFKHTTNTTENSDNYNPAEDSPCWKGAPASIVSPFGLSEALPPHSRLKKLETRDLLDFEEVQKFPPNEFVLDFSSQVCGPKLRKENLSTDNTTAVLPIKNLNAALPAKELSAADDAKLKSDVVQQNRYLGDQYSSNVESPIKQYSLLDASKSDSGSVQGQTKQLCPEEVSITPNMAGAENAGTSTSDTLEDGCIPLHYVENVLYSPPSKEGDGQPPVMNSSQKVNVQSLASALQNISKLLLLYSFDDKWELKEQESKTLEHAMRNINLCLSKKIVQLTPEQETMFSNADISYILKEGATQLRLDATDDVGNTAVDHLDSYSTHDKKKKFGVSDEKIEKNMDFVSPKNDADVTRHHNMVQNIKKVLDENFQLEEDISSETLLYKNLWLNAEAELCITGLKSRFDKVKIQSEDCKSYETKENSVVLKKIPSSNVSSDPCLDVASGLTPEANESQKQTTSVPYISSTRSDVNDDEKIVMARFQILKCRGDDMNTTNVEEKSLPNVVQPDNADVNDVDNSVMARFQILKCRGDSVNTCTVEEKSLPDDSDVNDVEDSVMAGFQILKCQGENISTSNVEGKSLPDVVQPEGTNFGLSWQIVGSQTGNKSFDVAVGSRVHPHSDLGNAKNVGSSPYDPKRETVKEEDSVMARLQILKCQGDNMNTSNVEEKSLPDGVQPEGTDFGVAWKIVGSQTGNKSFDVAVGSRVYPHSDHGNAKNAGSAPHDPKHETVKEFSVYDMDDSQPRRNISMHNELASGSGWHKSTPSDWDDSTRIQPRRNISMHNELASGPGWQKTNPSDWDDSTTIQPRRNISMHNELASDWDDSGSGWRKNTPSVWDDSGSGWRKNTPSIWDDSGSGWRKNTPSDWDDSTTIQPRKNISMNNDPASHSGWHKNTPSDWDDSTTIQPRGNINMHNELASGSGWYENTPLDWEHVLKDDYDWNK